MDGNAKANQVLPLGLRRALLGGSPVEEYTKAFS